MRKQPITHLKRRRDEMIVDNFAGGGGASTGFELAIGRSPDVAINHDPEALAMHKANHPWTRHYATDVFEIDPMVVCRNRPIGAAWFSPDCTHHSKARGGKPIREGGKKSRSLAWVVIRWARLPLHLRPRVILLENVEEFQDWGPLRDGKPCAIRKGKTFRLWVRTLQRLGYVVEWRELRACDYGAPTIRKRLFVIARCDGKKIVWPEPSHGKPGSPEFLDGTRLPWRTAAEIIEWTLPCPSIFMTPTEAKVLGVKRPLKEATLRRIARGLQRFVIDHPNPFIVPVTHSGSDRTNGIDEPLRTVTTAKRGEFALATPFLGSTAHSTSTGRGPAVWSAEEPIRTVTSSNDHVVVSPYVQTYHGDKAGADLRVASLEDPLRTQDTENRFSVVAPYAVPRYSEADGQLPRCSTLEQPVATITPTDNGASLVAPLLTREFGNSVGSDAGGPVPTVMPGGGGKTGLVSAFLTKFRTGATGQEAAAPFPTVTANSYVKRPGGCAPVGVVSAFMAQHNTGVVGHHATDPVSTLSQKGSQQQVVAAFLNHQRTSNTAGGNGEIDKPANAITAGGTHIAQVMAFLQLYYGQGGRDQDVRDPARTIPTKDRLGLVTVQGVDFQIVDIGMRMLSPRELYRAQGFPDGYRIAVHHNGRPLPKSSQVRMCGNSVCPPIAAALIKANCADLAIKERPEVRQRELAGV